MFIHYKNAIGILDTILKNWPLLAVLGFVSALSFQAGYMTFPLGLSVYHVSVEDLSKTGLLIFFSLLAFQFFMILLTAVGFFSSKSIKFLVAVLLLTLFMGSDIYSLALSPTQDDPIAVYLTKITLGTKILGAVLFAILYHQTNRSDEEVSIDLTGLFGLVALLLCYLFGVANFLTDIKSGKLSKITYSNGKDLNGVMIAERSEFYLSFLPAECTYVVVFKSAVSEVRFEKVNLSSFQLHEIGQCFYS
jgi:hypothetical protein